MNLTLQSSTTNRLWPSCAFSRNAWLVMFLFFILTLFSSSTVTQAGVIFDNLNAPQVGLEARSISWSAQSFVLGPTSQKLDSVDVKLIPHIGDGNFQVHLYSNSPSNQPGILLETLSGPNTPGFGQFHYDASGATTLAANSAYWIMFNSTGLNSYAVAGETEGIGISTGSTIGFKFSTDQGSIWQNYPYTVNMAVNGTVVPEPQFGMLIVGFMTVVLVVAIQKK